MTTVGRGCLSLLLLALFLSCTKTPAESINETEESGEIEVTFLKSTSIFDITIKEYRLAFNLSAVPVDSVAVIVIEEGEEFLYGSLRLEENRGTLESVKIPDFIEEISVDFMDGNGTIVRERCTVHLIRM